MAPSQHTWTRGLSRETAGEAADVYDRAEWLTEFFAGPAQELEGSAARLEGRI